VSVLAHNDGFIHDGLVTKWSEVRAVAAYKEDLFAYDEIWLAFKTSGNYWFEVSEHEEGFQAFAEEVGRRFSLPDGWFRELMLPAFARNYRVLWGQDRSSRSRQSGAGPGD
jgi:hypothetical protein